MQIYLVGGAVRNQLLGVPVAERDYLVVGTDAAHLKALGFKPLDAAFPVFQHPVTGDEYALARRERKVGLGYKGFIVEVDVNITLEEDLARRDLTINAIAQDPDGRLIDPFGGIADLHSGRLRHVTCAFVEDPVRLLRIARFAAQFRHLGFHIAHDTFKLLRTMATQDELTSLIPQRLRDELLKAIASESPWSFFTTLHRCGALQRLLPPLATAMGLPPPPPHQTVPLSPPIAALHRASTQTKTTSIRFAALLGAANLAPDNKICEQLQIDKATAELLFCSQTWTATKVAQATPELMLELLTSKRLLHSSEEVSRRLAQVWQAVEPAMGATAETKLAAARQAALSVSTTSLIAQGFAGPNLGAEIHRQRLLAIRNTQAQITA